MFYTLSASEINAIVSNSSTSVDYDNQLDSTYVIYMNNLTGSPSIPRVELQSTSVSNGFNAKNITSFILPNPQDINTLDNLAEPEPEPEPLNYAILISNANASNEKVINIYSTYGVQPVELNVAMQFYKIENGVKLNTFLPVSYTHLRAHET